MRTGFRRIWPYPLDRPPSGAIPRFPVWEVTAMFGAVFVGTSALIDPSAGRLTGLLGSIAMLFYICLVGGAITALVGMLMPAPGGLLTQLFAHGLLGVVAAAILVGLAVDLGRIVFSGSGILYVLTVGGAWRAGQLLNQLWRGFRESRDRESRGRG